MDHILKEAALLLNQKYNIQPVLYGSFALEKVTQTSFQAKDIDLLIPSYLLERKKQLILLFTTHGFEYIQKEVLTFRKDAIDVELADYDKWDFLCEFKQTQNRIMKTGEATYILMGKHNLLKLYHYLYKDRSRSILKHQEDIKKLKALNRLIEV
jgi:hypothetical protein